MKYLFDTNILSEPVKRDPDPGVVTRLFEPGLIIATSAIVWLELWKGYQALASGQKKTTVGDYLGGLRATRTIVLPYDEQCAELQAEFNAVLARKGRVLPVLDSMIAATALVHNLVLVTRNRSDFAGIPKLQVENWFTVSP